MWYDQINSKILFPANKKWEKKAETTTGTDKTKNVQNESKKKKEHQKGHVKSKEKFQALPSVEAIKYKVIFSFGK